MKAGRKKGEGERERQPEAKRERRSFWQAAGSVEFYPVRRGGEVQRLLVLPVEHRSHKG
jgi:hypothetical protein